MLLSEKLLQQTAAHRADVAAYTTLLQRYLTLEALAAASVPRLAEAVGRIANATTFTRIGNRLTASEQRTRQSS